ncbi:DUF6777 domain-containing protein [Streptomyces sp. NPDC002926]
MRSPIRRWYAAVAAPSVALLAAGCGVVGGAASSGAGSDSGSREIVLQPVAAQGPDPYTASTARNVAQQPPPPPRSSAPADPAGAGPTMNTFLGSTPGLYGGTEAIGSCDVGQQIALVSGDRAKVRAFAGGLGVAQADVPNFLRTLTPVVLRADTRMTGHGFRDGSATSYQSVLQAGTAVLVDQYGAPRVRCAGGNPLKPPVAVKGTVVHKGRPWAGYRPDQVIVIKPTTTTINNLVIVSVLNNSWIERRTGTDGEEDRKPEVLPPVNPDAVFTNPPSIELTGPSNPPESSGRSPSSGQSQPGNPTGPSDQVQPGDQSRPDSPTGQGLDTQLGGDPSTPDCPAPAALPPGEEPASGGAIEPGCSTSTLAEPVDPPLDSPGDAPVDPPVDPPVGPLGDPSVSGDVPTADWLMPSRPELFTPSSEVKEPDTFHV